ncbi:MAG: S41 family peptidase [Candidatus Beckwithbacteria bacterium]
MSRLIIVIILILVLGGGAFFFLKPKVKTPTDPYVAFFSETFDTIQTNYWDKLDDPALIDLYLQAARAVTQQPQLVKAQDKKDLFNQLKAATINQETAATIVDTVLANLPPAGKSRLYSQKQVTDLSNNVANINPEVNHYQELNLPKNATQTQIDAAYQTQSATATAKTKPQLDLAYQVLKDTTTREIYDTVGADPTLPHRLITSQIYYLAINKFSPTTIQELTATADATNQYSKLNTLILDLRDNIGGAIDGLSDFLAPFIGPDQYAYQFFQQDKKEDFTTKGSWITGLAKFKKVVILINQNTQSSAEVMAATMKKYHVGVLVGTTTRGWGTVESVFPLKNQLGEEQIFSLFLVHHLTLREDNQPIEGRGVDPNIFITDPAWRQQLLEYYNFPELINAVANLTL